MRSHTITRKVRTDFGSMYVHVEMDETGHVVGASISDPQKEPDTQIAKLVQALSKGLDNALQGLPRVAEAGQ